MKIVKKGQTDAQEIPSRDPFSYDLSFCNKKKRERFDIIATPHFAL